jgi:hypothetical protein
MENILPCEELKPKIRRILRARIKSHAESPVYVVAKKAKKILKKF